MDWTPRLVLTISCVVTYVLADSCGGSAEDTEEESKKNAGAGYVILGAGLSCLGAGLSACGNITLKYSRELYQKQNYEPPCIKDPWMALVIFIYILNGVADFAGLAFVSLAVAAPTSGFTIVVNGVLAWYVFGERMGTQDWIGCSLIVIGCGIGMSFASHQAAERTVDDMLTLWKRDAMTIYMIVDLSILALAFFFSRHLRPNHPGWWTYLSHQIPIFFCIVAAPDEDEEENADTDEPALTPTKTEAPTSPADVHITTDETSKEDGAAISDGAPVTTPFGGGLCCEARPQGPVEDQTLGEVPTSTDGDGNATSTAPSVVAAAATTTADDSAKKSKAQLHRLAAQAGGGTGYIFRLQVLAYALVPTIMGTWTQLLGKISVEMIRTSVETDCNSFSRWEAWLFLISLGFSAYAQLQSLSAMVAMFDATQCVPVFQILFVMSLIIAGSVYFDEFSAIDADPKLGSFAADVVVFSIGIVLCFVGIFLVLGHEPLETYEAEQARLEKEAQEAAAAAAAESAAAGESKAVAGVEMEQATTHKE